VILALVLYLIVEKLIILPIVKLLIYPIKNNLIYLLFFQYIIPYYIVGVYIGYFIKYILRRFKLTNEELFETGIIREELRESLL